MFIIKLNIITLDKLCTISSELNPDTVPSRYVPVASF